MTGTLKIDGTTISDVSVTADLRTLKSDKEMRDNRIHSIGLESDKFPEAKFVLTEPIELAAVPAAGETVKADATGDFTLHGVTRTGHDSRSRAGGTARRSRWSASSRSSSPTTGSTRPTSGDS